MLAWTKDDYEDIGLYGDPKTIKRFKATANGKDAYTIEQDPYGGWALFRKWTASQVEADGVSIGYHEDVEEVKAKAEEDIKRWRDLIDELTMPF